MRLARVWPHAVMVQHGDCDWGAVATGQSRPALAAAAGSDSVSDGTVKLVHFSSFISAVANSLEQL